jgi:uncharacterized Zn finger protein
MSWNYFYKPYVSVAERRRKAEQEARRLAKQGRKLQPVQPEGRKIATTFWGEAWCDNLTSYSDFANRLPRGRSYLTNGSVIDLQINAGKVSALVQGSELYTVTIKIDALSEKRWAQFKKDTGGSITNLLDLLQGKLSKDILTAITARGTGLFPAPAEIHMNCSCPDWADVCKHVAAVMYGVGTRLDSNPELFFTLRGVDMQELIGEAGKVASQPLKGKPRKSAGAAALADADLSELFGVDIEAAGAPVEAATARPKRGAVKPKVKVKRAATKTPAKSKPAARKRAAK